MKTKVSMLVAVLGLCLSAMAQQAPEALRPPKGAKVSIHVFEDLECPSCRATEPLLKDAEKTEGVPLVRHDFPIPNHRWSAQAHVIARYFDSLSPQLGEEYRHWAFMNQSSINKSNLLQKSNEWAAQHGKGGLPFAIDPQGKFQAQVTADKQLGESLHVSQTPTVFVTGDVKNGPSMVELNQITDLNQAIENMKRQVATEESANKATKPAKKSATKKK